MKYGRKFLASSSYQNIFIAYIKKIYHWKHSGADFLVRNITNNQHSRVSIKFWQSISEGLFKAEYLNKFSQYFGNLAKAVMRSHNKKLLSKASKIFGEDNKIFNF